MTKPETNKLFRFGSFRASMKTGTRSMKLDKKIIENNNHERVEKEDQSHCCVICVGSTGTGKSSTVGKYTGVNTKAGSGTERVTTYCQIHRSLVDDQEPVWVDTVGWDDAECEDDQTFKDILIFINKYEITKVSAIIWNIVPNVRRDGLLVEQARLINKFKEKEIWRNVLIVAKQSLNPEVDCQGAVRAAQEFSDFPVLHTGYRFYSDPTISPEQRHSFCTPQSREMFNVKTDQEVKTILQGMLGKMGPPVQVVFNTTRCLDCSAEGDRRLLPKYCHMEPHLVHDGGVENHHPGKIERFHPSQHQVLEHEGRLKKTWYSHFLCGTLRKPRYNCCGRRSGKEGCHRKWACCKEEWDTLLGDMMGCSSRYMCCGASTSQATGGCSPRYTCCWGEVTTQGCRKVCKKCGEDWGGTTEDCFIKEHNIIEIGEEEVDTETEEIEENEYHPFITGEDKLCNIERSINKFKLLDKFPPIITYHLI